MIIFYFAAMSSLTIRVLCGNQTEFDYILDIRVVGAHYDRLPKFKPVNCILQNVRLEGFLYSSQIKWLTRGFPCFLWWLGWSWISNKKQSSSACWIKSTNIIFNDRIVFHDCNVYCTATKKAKHVNHLARYKVLVLCIARLIDGMTGKCT